LKKVEYDFLSWSSFPSSLKMINDEARRGPWLVLFHNQPTTPGARITATFKIKEEHTIRDPSGLWGVMIYWNREPAPLPIPGKAYGWTWLEAGTTPLGTHDWMDWEIKAVHPVPSEGRYLLAYLVGPPGGISWWDDLKIYQDNKLIYENKFSNWLPYQIAGAIAISIPTALYAIPKLKRR